MTFLMKCRFLLAGGLVFLSPQIIAQTPVRFTIDWAWQGSQAIWPMAQDMGCFAREKLDVRADRGFGSGDAIGKVAAGAYDLGFADFNALVQFNATNPGKRVIGIFMVYDGSPTSITTLKASGVTKPADLAGKKIAGPVFDASRQNFPVFARTNGLDPSKVEWSSVSPELRETLLARRQVDAVAGHMWTSLIGLQALGVKRDEIVTLLYANYGLDLFGSALVAAPAWVQANPRAATSFITCVVEGVNGALADPKAAIAALKKRDALIPEDVETERLRLSLEVAVLTDNVKKNGMNTIDSGRMDRSLKLVSEIFGSPLLKVEDVWTNAYLPPRDKLQIRR